MTISGVESYRNLDPKSTTSQNGVWRGRPISKNSDCELELPQVGVKRDRSGRPLSESRLDKPQVLTRDDALDLGLFKMSQRVADVISDMSDSELNEWGYHKVDFEVKETATEQKLSDEDASYIEQIAKNYSQTIASQMLELIALSKDTIKVAPNTTRKALRFAERLLETLQGENADVEMDTFTELEECYLQKAQRYFQGVEKTLGIKVPEEKIIEAAQTIQLVARNSENEVQEDESEEEYNDEYHVSRVLGNILFILDNDPHSISECFDRNEVDVSSEAIIDKSYEIMQGAVCRIEKYHRLLVDTAVHDIKQSLNHFTCIEIAKHLLLKNGSFNFGMIDDVIDALVPEILEGTEAIKNSYYILGNLASSSLSASSIYKSSLPKSKKIPSNDLVKATLTKTNDSPLLNYDVKVTILSGLIENVRQGNVGSCFATAALIKLVFSRSELIVEDYIDAIESGKMRRRILNESKCLPFMLRTSREGLDTLLTINSDGYLVDVRPYNSSPDRMKEMARPSGKAFVWEVPGIVAACRVLGYDNEKNVVSRAISQLQKFTFTSEELIRSVAEISFADGKREVYSGEDKLEELRNIGIYAFGVQQRHALHSAWEQMAAAAVSYFASQFTMAFWVYESFEATVKLSDSVKKKKGRQFSRKYTALIDQVCLPMITRMRYRYNHFIEEDKRFFKGNRGVSDVAYYGYELCDVGLPADFEYSTDFLKCIKNGDKYFYPQKFNEFSAEENWKKIKKENYQDFLCDVVMNTAQYLERESRNSIWKDVAQQMCKQIRSKVFPKNITANLLGKHHRDLQDKEFKINEFTCHSTPWMLRWGGSSDEVLKSLYSFNKQTAENHEYSGTPFETLVWRIDYLKKQPQSIMEKQENYFDMTAVMSPCHAFLLRPGLPQFQQAVKSELPTVEWVKQNVVGPGQRIANAKILERSKNALIELITTNSWFSLSSEKEDLQRQELTDFSKLAFDNIIDGERGLWNFSVDEFRDCIFKAVISSRAEDPNIGSRNVYWERKFSSILKNKTKQLAGNRDLSEKVTKRLGEKIIDFARNRTDIMHLSENAINHLLEMVRVFPKSLSNSEFRAKLMEAASLVRKNDLGLPGADNRWDSMLARCLDNKIYELLPANQKKRLTVTGIVTDDTNWSDDVHVIFFTWLVNPGSGQLELCQYNKDLNKVSFMNQVGWFSRKEYSRWTLPKNYVTYAHEPIFNVKKFTGI
ncbi:MAG: hypothetical protein VX777_05590 [Chlamydiota bacterium]|nr:hypothetical protein [Chlamydiota bacterium]